MIKVIKGMVKSGGVFHSINDTITGLSDKEETRLIYLGVCEKVVTESAKEESAVAETAEKSQKATKTNASSTAATDEIKLNVDDVVVGAK